MCASWGLRSNRPASVAKSLRDEREKRCPVCVHFGLRGSVNYDSCAVPCISMGVLGGESELVPANVAAEKRKCERPGAGCFSFPYELV